MSVSWCCVGCLSCAFWQPCNDIHASRWIFFVHLVCWFTKNIVSQIRCAARRDNMCMLSSSEKIRWRASLGSFHRNEFLRRVVIRYRIPSFTCNTKYNCICFASDVLASPILHPRRIFLLGGVSFNNFNLGNKEWFFSRHVSRTSRFNMITLHIILSDLLRRSKNPYWFLRHLLLLQVETLPYHHDILRWGSLSLRWIPVSEWVLGIRSLFLLILLSHLPQEISILHLVGLSELISHSVFWDMFLMHLTFPILQSQQSEYILPKFSSRTKHVLEGFPKSSFIFRFHVCQEVLVIS